jgi:hypothetical protein
MALQASYLYQVLTIAQLQNKLTQALLVITTVRVIYMETPMRASLQALLAMLIMAGWIGLQAGYT